jgi:hypothetical protein
MTQYNITTETTHRILFQGVEPEMPLPVLRQMGRVHQAILDVFYDDMEYVDDINSLYPLHTWIAINGTDYAITVFALSRSYLRSYDSLGWFIVITTPETGAHIIDNVAPEDRRVALADMVMMPGGVRELWEATY